jgi:hypothetical protein
MLFLGHIVALLDEQGHSTQLWRQIFPGELRPHSDACDDKEHTEDHPMAHLREPGIEVWPEPQLPETVPFGSKSDLK